MKRYWEHLRAILGHGTWWKSKIAVLTIFEYFASADVLFLDLSLRIKADDRIVASVDAQVSRSRSLAARRTLVALIEYKRSWFLSLPTSIVCAAALLGSSLIGKTLRGGRG